MRQRKSERRPLLRMPGLLAALQGPAERAGARAAGGEALAERGGALAAGPGPEAVDDYLAAVAAVGQILTPEEAGERRRRAVKGTWRAFLPVAAELGARLLRAEAGRFPGLGFSAEELAAGPARLRDLERVCGALIMSLERVERAMLLHKQRTAERTRALHAAVQHRLADPGLAGEERRRLRSSALALLEQFSLHAAQQERRRQQTLRRRAPPAPVAALPPPMGPPVAASGPAMPGPRALLSTGPAEAGQGGGERRDGLRPCPGSPRRLRRPETGSAGRAARSPPGGRPSSPRYRVVHPSAGRSVRARMARPRSSIGGTRRSPADHATCAAGRHPSAIAREARNARGVNCRCQPKRCRAPSGFTFSAACRQA